MQLNIEIEELRSERDSAQQTVSQLKLKAQNMFEKCRSEVQKLEGQLN